MADKLYFLIKRDQIDLLRPNACQSFVFNEHEFGAGRIYNPTKIAIAITNYLQANYLLKKPGIVVFEQSLVQAELVPSSDRHVDHTMQMHVKTRLNQDWSYQAILKPGMLLQYQLLFAQIGVYIEVFTSEMIFHIEHLSHLVKKDLSDVDNLVKLQEIVNSIELDLHTKFVQTVGKFNA